jgi:hypothetical protein
VGAVFDARFQGPKLPALFQKMDPIVKGLMGRGRADKDKMEIGKEGAAAHGLMGLAIVAQQGGLE